jgi:hypothetical protein
MQERCPYLPNVVDSARLLDILKFVIVTLVNALILLTEDILREVACKDAYVNASGNVHQLYLCGN